MDNRFGIKDLIIIVLLVLVIVSVFLSMKQFDRQWEDVQQIQTQVQQLTTEQAQTRNDVGRLYDLIEQGVKVSGTGKKPVETEDGFKAGIDPHFRVEEARAQKDFSTGDWLVDAFGAKLQRITPLVNKDLYSRTVHYNVLQQLIKPDRDGDGWVGELAKSWKVSEDGLTITFKLRRAPVWSDGTPVTAHDVVFTLDLMNNPKLDAASLRTYYDNIKSATAVNDHEVVFKMGKPHFAALSMCGWRPIIPRHFYTKFTIEEINTKPGLLLGSGPYRMPDPTNWAPGKLIELVRNERYWGPQGGFDKIVYFEIESEVAELTKFRNGETDIFGATAEQFEELKKDPEIRKRAEPMVYDIKPSGYTFIAWNQKRDGKPTIFADKRVRQALTFLTERERIAKELSLGYARVTCAPFTPGTRQNDPNLKPRKFNVEKGKAALKEAGWEDRNNDGILENAKGDLFTFKLTYGSGSPWFDRLVLYLKDSYARAGIKMELDPLEWAVFTDRLEQQNFDAVSLGWGGGAIESDIRQAFHTDQTKKGGDNFVNHSNPELDAMIDKARTTVDEDTRMPLWQHCHRIIYEDQPYTFLFTRKATVFIDKRIHNVQTLDYGLNTRPTNKWYVPGPMQKRGARR